MLSFLLWKFYTADLIVHFQRFCMLFNYYSSFSLFPFLSRCSHQLSLKMKKRGIGYLNLGGKSKELSMDSQKCQAIVLWWLFSYSFLTSPFGIAPLNNLHYNDEMNLVILKYFNLNKEQEKLCSMESNARQAWENYISCMYCYTVFWNFSYVILSVHVQFQMGSTINLANEMFIYATA